MRILYACGCWDDFEIPSHSRNRDKVWWFEWKQKQVCDDCRDKIRLAEREKYLRFEEEKEAKLQDLTQKLRKIGYDLRKDYKSYSVVFNKDCRVDYTDLFDKSIDVVEEIIECRAIEADLAKKQAVKEAQDQMRGGYLLDRLLATKKKYTVKGEDLELLKKEIKRLIEEVTYD